MQKLSSDTIQRAAAYDYGDLIAYAAAGPRSKALHADPCRGKYRQDHGHDLDVQLLAKA